MNNEQLEKTERIFFIILGIDILITLIFGIKAFLYAEIFQQIQAGSRVVDQALISNMELADKFRLLPIFTWLAVGYGLVKWLNACYRYAEESIGVKELKNRKWTILGWAIPFLNIYKPYQIINEIFKVGSQRYNSPTNWKKESSSTPLIIWWVFYFLSHFAILRIGMDANSKLANPDVAVKIYISVFQEQVWLSGISIAIAVLWLIVANYLTKRLVMREPVNFTDTSQSLLERTSESKQHIDEAVSNTDEDQYFSQVAKEMVSGQRDEGLWAKAYALQDGDDKKTKAHYIRLRVKQLINKPISHEPLHKNLMPEEHLHNQGSRNNNSPFWPRLKALFKTYGIIIYGPLLIWSIYTNYQNHKKNEESKPPIVTTPAVNPDGYKRQGETCENIKECYPGMYCFGTCRY